MLGCYALNVCTHVRTCICYTYHLQEGFIICASFQKVIPTWFYFHMRILQMILWDSPNKFSITVLCTPIHPLLMEHSYWNGIGILTWIFHWEYLCTSVKYC